MSEFTCFWPKRTHSRWYCHRHRYLSSLEHQRLGELYKPEQRGRYYWILYSIKQYWPDGHDTSRSSDKLQRWLGLNLCTVSLLSYLWLQLLILFCLSTFLVNILWHIEKCIYICTEFWFSNQFQSECWPIFILQIWLGTEFMKFVSSAKYKNLRRIKKLCPFGHLLINAHVVLAKMLDIFWLCYQYFVIIEYILILFSICYNYWQRRMLS